MINSLHRENKQLQNEINAMKLGLIYEGSDELIPFHEFKHRARAEAYLKRICITVIVVTFIIVVVTFRKLIIVIVKVM